MRTVRLGEVVDILSGFAFPSEQFGDSGDLPVVRIRDVVRGRSSTFFQGDFDERYILSNGDILIGMDGEFKRARWRGGRALLNQRVCRIRSSADELDDSYLFYYLPRALKAIEDVTPFVTVKHLSAKQIRDIDIPLPPLPEQRRIAAILHKADELRAKRRAALEQLSTLRQSIFSEMFGALLANVSEHAVPLRDCAEVVSGVAKGRTFNGRTTVDVPYLRVANVQAGFLDLSEVKTIPALPDEVEALRLMPGDVVLTEGGDFDKLGRGAVWTGGIENCIHQNHVFRVRFNQSVLSEYFHEYLQTVPARAYFLRCAKKTTNLASINMTQLRALPVVVPEVAHQRKFVSGARAVSSLDDTMVASLRASETLFASLQQQAFAGAL